MTDILHIALDLDDKAIEDVLSEFETGVDKGVQDAVSKSSALILNRIRERFLAQVSPEGVPWEPSYAAFKRSFMGRDGGTLFDTGNLFHSIQLYSVSPYEQAIGTDVPYAQFHQYGTSKLPIREFLGFNQEDADLALAVLIRSIKAALP